jgi:enoyl-CoA hydratase
MSSVDVDVDGATLVIAINRPAARNAIDLEAAEAIAAAVDRLDDDPALRVAVLTGRGGTFCAGMDLKSFSRGERPTLPGRGFAGLTEQAPTKPLIAAVDGYALGGGFELVLSSDLVVASADAQFGLVEVKRGLVAAAGGLMRLPRRIPYHHAMDLVLSGRLMTGTQAYELGLVNRIADPGASLDTAMELAGEISANGPLAVQASMRIIRESRTWGADEFALQREISEPVMTSRDAAEGARAFAEKRAPQWAGR